LTTLTLDGAFGGGHDELRARALLAQRVDASQQHDHRPSVDIDATLDVPVGPEGDKQDTGPNPELTALRSGLLCRNSDQRDVFNVEILQATIARFDQYILP
jgi:hypothetical protein